jgi:hypothetical protein
MGKKPKRYYKIQQDIYKKQPRKGRQKEARDVERLKKLAFAKGMSYPPLSPC